MMDVVSPTTTPATAPAPPTEASLAHLPVTIFASVMGLAGTSLAWRRAGEAFGAPIAIAQALGWIAVTVFALAVLGYAAKTVRFPAATRGEWRHPIRIAFVPTISISLLLLSAVVLPDRPALSAGLWWVGAAAQLAFTLDVIRVWMADPRFALAHVHPGWFIPVVGNLVVPLAGVAHAPADISWFFFAIGLVYWLPMLALVLSRLMVGDALPDRLSPTVAILIAPPAVAALAWVRLGGDWSDAPARVLLGVTVFQVLLLAAQAPRLVRLPFALSAWAGSFPLAAASSALLAAHASRGVLGFAWLGAATLAATSTLVTILTARTALALIRGELVRPE